jgi:periplasmic copper chaperone A
MPHCATAWGATELILRMDHFVHSSFAFSPLDSGLFLSRTRRARKLPMSLFAAFLSLLMVMPALAADIEVEHAWLRAPAPGQAVVGGFLDITSNAHDAALVSASSPVADVTELHEMSMKDGVMIMRPVPYIRLPKGQTIKLAPGGLHLMLIDLKRQLKAGDHVPLTLKILSGNKSKMLNITAEVRDPLAAGMHREHPPK